MKEQTIFPREEHADVLFQKILADPWACDKLFETFCNDLFSNDELEDSLSADEFCQALFRACLLYTSPSPRDRTRSRMPSSA